MRGKWLRRGLRFALFGVLGITVVTLVFMSLWNWLTPALFGWRLINFWQALGLLVLSRFIFGGFRGRMGCGSSWRRRMSERWEQMTPEEREKFRQGMRGRCGQFGEPAPEVKA
jgi:hypothetical protein